ncbi:MAG: YciI family protein [Rhizobacter sp.]
MPYMLLIVEQVGQRLERGDTEGRELYGRMLRWGEDLKTRGLLLAGESLKSQDADTARITVRSGKQQVLDGPFTEAKEMIGGFFLVDCKTRDEAIAIATGCPAAQWCTIEVRAVAPCYT